MSPHRSPGGRCIVARQEAKKDVFLNFWSHISPHIDAWTSLACSAAVLLRYNDQTYYFTRRSRGLKVDDAFSFDRSSTWSSTITLRCIEIIDFGAPGRRPRAQTGKASGNGIHNFFMIEHRRFPHQRRTLPLARSLSQCTRFTWLHMARRDEFESMIEMVRERRVRVLADVRRQTRLT